MTTTKIGINGFGRIGRIAFRIASEKSQFAMPASKLALGYPFEAVNRLINAVGLANAKMLMFTAKRIDAETAFKMGFVQEVVPEDLLEKRCFEIAAMISDNAPLTIAAMKYISIQNLGFGFFQRHFSEVKLRLLIKQSFLNTFSWYVS